MDNTSHTFIIHFILFIFIQKASCQVLYVGCYDKLSTTFNPILDPIQSPANCLEECKPQGASFAAIKDGSHCFCVDETKAKVNSSNCNSLCSKHDGSCGGKEFYSLYSAVPTYHGCFKDDIEDRDLPMMSSSGNFKLTVEGCYKNCSREGYRFMGVQTGGQCFCGHTFGKHDMAEETECQVPCSGQSNKMCGGTRRNNIYAVNHFLGLNMNYNQVFRCVDGTGNFKYKCVDNKCQYGWKGAMCNIRDCSINNGHCGEHKCEEIKIGTQLISECVCKEGFHSSSIYHECTDIDECLSNPCNGPSETCINTHGSFKCNCSPGYNCTNKTATEESKVGEIIGVSLGTITVLILVIAAAYFIYCMVFKRKNKVDAEKNDTGSV